ncbi:hypothetical protein DPMN_167100 [Dreissena polymorpha]|uniref:L-Fucosyltransferase n=2 Tax=Dreissena polymorpha TaxID=45954 RepID=A0A9D4F2M6_DREPO|nr:hypothetical protein DPMN_167100 [Dreissena polymorpha]
MVLLSYSKPFFITTGPTPFFVPTGVTTVASPIQMNYTNSPNGILTRSSNFSTLIIRLKGRLGNMMFQYASILGIAATCKFSNVVVERGEHLREIFSFSNTKVSFSASTMSSTSIREKKSGTFDNRLVTLNNSVSFRVDGYLQSWRYFEAIRDTVRKEFTFSTEISNKAWFRLHDVLKTFNVTNATFVGVHIRRGDFTYNKKYGFLTAPLEYIIKSMNIFLNLYSNRTVFVICSDGIKWAKDALSNVTSSYNMYFMEGNSAEVDMAILSKCNHTIITTGTFSWWAAWLAGRYDDCLQEAGVGKHVLMDSI